MPTQIEKLQVIPLGWGASNSLSCVSANSCDFKFGIFEGDSSVVIKAIVDAAFVPGLLCGIVDDSLAHFVAF